MSATMRVDGEIQKLFGVEDIYHIQQQVDVVEATGRRIVLGLDPGALQPDGRGEIDAALEPIDRLICITPSESEWTDLLQKAPSLRAKHSLDAGETERSRDQFLGEQSAVLTYFGRYEGLDVPNDKCRVIILSRSRNKYSTFGQRFHLKHFCHS